MRRLGSLARRWRKALSADILCRSFAAVLTLGCVATGFCQGHRPHLALDSCAANAYYAQNATYVGSDTCQSCHEDSYKRMAGTVHWKKMTAASTGNGTGQLPNGCESCHGPGSAHVEGGGDPAKIFAFSPGSAVFCNPCRSCHQDLSVPVTGSGSASRRR